jgi:hypothetical protein
MKNEKLHGLLNKLVQLKTDTDHLKGFLFRDNGGEYFIKPIEVYSGSAKESGKFWLKDEHIEFTNFCESPKLMKVSMKSWHYRLMKYVLGSNTPTPKTMQNGCPYFWLLVFSVIIAPFKVAGQGILAFFLGFPFVFYYGIELMATAYMRYMPEESAMTTYERNSGYYGQRYEGMPIITKMHFKHTRYSFIDTYVKIRYGIDKSKDPLGFAAKLTELETKFKEHQAKREAEARARSAKESELFAANRLRQNIANDKAEVRRLKSEAFWLPFHQKMEKISDGIVKVMTFDYKNNSIIKLTKQVMGFLLSVLILGVTAGFVTVLSWAIIEMIDGIVYFFTNFYTYFFMALGGIAALATVVGIGYIIFNWIQTILGRYKIGKKVWYVQGFVYAIGYPIKYLIAGIAGFFWYVIILPIKFIFYTVIFKSILVPIWKLLSGIGIAFGGILLGSFGIFGEYFGASKKDYCPGIEWTDTDEA